MIWLWILLNDMILNVTRRYDIEWDWMIWLWISEINIFRILRILILSWLLVNKSLMISMFSFSTAKYNAVLSNNIKILLNDMILNEIE